MGRSVDERVSDVRCLAAAAGARLSGPGGARAGTHAVHGADEGGRRAGVRVPRACGDPRRASRAGRLRGGRGPRPRDPLGQRVHRAAARDRHRARGVAPRERLGVLARPGVRSGAHRRRARSRDRDRRGPRRPNRGGRPDRRVRTRPHDRDGSGAREALRGRPGPRRRPRRRGLDARGGRSPGAAEALAQDVVPFDQRGCLSPRIVLVEGSSDRGVDFAGVLDECLRAWGRRAPRGLLSREERADATRWREALAFAGRVWASDHHVVAFAPPGTPLAVPPSGRHVLVAGARSLDGVAAQNRVHRPIRGQRRYGRSGATASRRAAPRPGRVARAHAAPAARWSRGPPVLLSRPLDSGRQSGAQPSSMGAHGGRHEQIRDAGPLGAPWTLAAGAAARVAHREASDRARRGTRRSDRREGVAEVEGLAACLRRCCTPRRRLRSRSPRCCTRGAPLTTPRGRRAPRRGRKERGKRAGMRGWLLWMSTCIVLRCANCAVSL